MSGSNFFRKDSLYSHEKSAGAGMQIIIKKQIHYEIIQLHKIQSFCFYLTGNFTSITQVFEGMALRLLISVALQRS